MPYQRYLWKWSNGAGSIREGLILLCCPMVKMLTSPLLQTKDDRMNFYVQTNPHTEHHLKVQVSKADAAEFVRDFIFTAEWNIICFLQRWHRSWTYGYHGKRFPFGPYEVPIITQPDNPMALFPALHADSEVDQNANWCRSVQSAFLHSRLCLKLHHLGRETFKPCNLGIKRLPLLKRS